MALKALFNIFVLRNYSCQFSSPSGLASFLEADFFTKKIMAESLRI